ncbi:hypothetical protein QW131_22220 [Roseibium salinum]|nr:hypothetical protein [Roseibium salinum]
MFAGAAVLAIVQLAAYSVTTALIVQLAYDAKLRRRVHIGRYLRPALTALPPILILSFAVGALIVGLFFLLGLFGAVSRILALAATPVQIVLSLWILAVFFRHGSCRRYRARRIQRPGTKRGTYPGLPLADHGNIFFLTAAIALIMLIIGVFVIGFFGTLGASLIAGILIAALSSSALSILAIAASLIYARLREIKEGVSVDQVATVFD